MSKSHILSDLSIPYLVTERHVSDSFLRNGGSCSSQNVNDLRKLGVRDVGLAPRGRTAWQVDGRVRDKLIAERALVEGSIGTLKCPKYGFNRPSARSIAMMGVCGQRAALGLNLTKLLRGVAQKRGLALPARVTSPSALQHR
jgi:hypothetical protein